MSRAGGRGEGVGVAREGGGWMGMEGKNCVETILPRHIAWYPLSMVTLLVCLHPSIVTPLVWLLHSMVIHKYGYSLVWLPS